MEMVDPIAQTTQFGNFGTQWSIKLNTSFDTVTNNSFYAIKYFRWIVVNISTDIIYYTSHTFLLMK